MCRKVEKPVGLPPAEVRVYRMDTEALADEAVFAEQCRRLSPKRQEKIRSLSREADRRLSLGAGLLLDYGLRAYGMSEAEAEIEAGIHGKPFLREPGGIFFNLSHSGSQALAVFAGAETGCDIEQVRAPREKLARRFFCRSEYEWIQKAEDSEEKKERFYRIWTLKESFVKAAGEGLGIRLDSFCFSMEGPSGVSLRTEIPGFETAVFFEYGFEGYGAAICLCKKTDRRPPIRTVKICGGRLKEATEEQKLRQQKERLHQPRQEDRSERDL